MMIYVREQIDRLDLRRGKAAIKQSALIDGLARRMDRLEEETQESTRRRDSYIGDGDGDLEQESLQGGPMLQREVRKRVHFEGDSDTTDARGAAVTQRPSEYEKAPELNISTVIEAVISMKHDLVERLVSFKGVQVELAQRVSSLELQMRELLSHHGMAANAACAPKAPLCSRPRAASFQEPPGIIEEAALCTPKAPMHRRPREPSCQVAPAASRAYPSSEQHVWRSPFEFLTLAELARAREVAPHIHHSVPHIRGEPPDAASIITDIDAVIDVDLADWAQVADLLGVTGQDHA